MNTPTLFLIDGSSYLYRAFNALPPLHTRTGEPTNAIYGVLSMVRKLLNQQQPDYLAVIFDAPGKTFRHRQFPDYKANRPPMPDDLRGQIAPLHQAIKTMGLPLLQIDDVEADDVIATLARQAEKDDVTVRILSGDKDLTQLVCPAIHLFDPMKDTLLDEAGVLDKFGVPARLMGDYLALIGDKTDNIPGVPGIGPKTAIRLLNQYDDLDDIMANADAIKGKMGDNLRQCLQQIPLSRKLVTLDESVTLPTNYRHLTIKQPDEKQLQELYRRYEFKTWLTTESPEKATDTEVIVTENQLLRWLEKLQTADIVALDTETTGLNYTRATLVGLSFAVTTGQAAYLPLAHDYIGAPEQLAMETTLKLLKPWLENPDSKKIGQNLKYDSHILANHGISLKGIHDDTMLESHVLNSTASRHDMDSLARYYLDMETIHYEDVAGKGAKQIPFNQVPLESAAPYAAEDADITLRLHQHLTPKLQNIPSLNALYREQEMPLVPVLVTLERNGVLIDADRLKSQGNMLLERCRQLETEAHDLAGENFNLNSTQQLQQILFEQMKLPVVKKTPKGKPSTAEEVLQRLAEDYPLPALILKYRSLSKLQSTYVDKLPRTINNRTGRVHTSYHQAGTATGRLASSDPNLQNIPIRTMEGRQIRQAFIAPQGYRLLAADYSQIELRIMAHLSEDPGLTKAFAGGLDVHRATAAEVFDITMDQVTDNQRRTAKAINFGLIYGMSAFGLARQLTIPQPQAQDYVNRYFQRYPGVQAFMDEIRDKAGKQGYVETVFGRRLYLPDLQSRNNQIRQGAERTAINAPMQGTAADIIKRAMLAVDHWLQHDNIDAKMIMQVHDELVFEVAEKEIHRFQKELPGLMTDIADLKVMLEVDVGIGDNWDEAH